MNMTIEDITVFLSFTLVMLVMVVASLWAMAKEEQLGIAGMSSERILVQEEMRDSRENRKLGQTIKTTIQISGPCV